MQQTYGNQAVVQLLAAGGDGPRAPVLPNAAPGNRAVIQLLPASKASSGRSVQRAPDDDEGPTSYPAVSMPPRSLGPTSMPAAFGTNEADPAAMLPDPDVIVPVGGKNVAPPTPRPVPAGFGGGVDPSGRTVLKVAPHAVPDANVRKQYREDPSSVFRSPSADWHQEMWLQMKLPDQPDEAPVAFAAGPLVAVHPRYPGPATAIPSSYAGNDVAGLGAPQAPTETPLDRTAPAPGRPLGTAVAPSSGGVPGFGGTPGFVSGPQGPGRQTAVPASTVDVLAAMKADPSSVKRSPSAEFHAQMYQLDQGKGSTTPTAFRVGNQILVAPDHPIKGVETLAIPGGGAPAGGTPGAPAAGAAAAIPTAPGGSGGRRVKGDVNVTKGAPGVKGSLMVEDETTEGGTTTKKGKGAIGSVGGGNVASVGGQSVVTETTGDTGTTTKKQASLTLKPDGSLVLGNEKSKETFKGTNEAGEPIKTGETKTNKSIGLSEKGLTGQAGATRETAGGHKVGAQGSVTIDGKGNISGEGSLKLESKGGTSLTPSISGGVSVQASDPTPAEGGGYDVTYTVTTSSGVGLGAGKQFGGGPSIGIQLGSTEATLETGSRHFDDIKKAQAFRDKAAAVIAGERFLAYPPPTTVEGALLIPIGEERGSGDVSGSSYGGSVSFEGASLGYGKSEGTTHQFKVRHTRDKVVQVTGSVSGTTGSDVTGSGGITLTRGSSETKGFEVVWEIDLGTTVGRNAFELYARNGYPPLGAKMISMTSSGSSEDHDNVKIPLLGTARWTGTTWEVVKTDEKGAHAQFGGQQAHDQDPSWTGRHILGQDELHSSAQITSNLEKAKGGKQEEDYQAQIKVSGESGEYNRKELGRIFMGVPHAGAAKPSGEWTLTAKVSPDVVHELERLNRDMRTAKTREDKMRIYSELIKERGAGMVGAQVGLGGDPLAWSLELKGDRNFPGPAGRAALEGRRSELKARLGKDQATARGIVSDAQRTLDELRARRIAVADEERYTDLPDGLRDQQLKLIDKHISDFEFIRHQALRAALKGEAPAKPDAKAGAKPGEAAGGYKNDKEAAESADMLKLRTQIDAKETGIGAIDPRISRLVNAIKQASRHTVNVDPRYGGWVLAHRATYNEHWGMGVDINDRQFAMAPRIDALRQQVLEHLFESDRKAAAQQLVKLLTDRLDLLETLHIHLVSAAEALKPITTEKGMKGYPRFWGSIKGDEPPWLGGFGSSED